MRRFLASWVIMSPPVQCRHVFSPAMILNTHMEAKFFSKVLFKVQGVIWSPNSPKDLIAEVSSRERDLGSSCISPSAVWTNILQAVIWSPNRADCGDYEHGLGSWVIMCLSPSAVWKCIFSSIVHMIAKCFSTAQACPSPIMSNSTKITTNTEVAMLSRVNWGNTLVHNDSLCFANMRRNASSQSKKKHEGFLNQIVSQLSSLPSSRVPKSGRYGRYIFATFIRWC